ncbi:MAG: efflux RND transporter periplasmic adaptor subunit [Rhodocyclaceae bacterium]
MITWRLFGLTLVAMALAACERKPPPPEPPRPVLTQVVGAQGDAARVTYSGAVQARFEQTLSFRVGGKLTRRSVDAGQRVKAGAELARLDPQDNALNVQAARAQIAQVEANLKLARNELDRAKSLHERNFIAQSVVDQRQAQVTAAEAQLQSARAQAAITGNQAGYTVLRADQDGVIAAVMAEEGQVVAAGQAVVKLARNGDREVAISLPEGAVDTVRRAGAATVTLWALPGRSLQGRVREVSPVADPATRTWAARIALDGPLDGIELGMTATVAFAQPHAGAMVVPMGAIFQQGQQAAVWVVGADEHVQLVPVTVSRYGESQAVVSAGLKGGERIVIAGVHKLTRGEQVDVMDQGDARFGAAPR